MSRSSPTRDPSALAPVSAEPSPLKPYQPPVLQDLGSLVALTKPGPYSLGPDDLFEGAVGGFG